MKSVLLALGLTWDNERSFPTEPFGDAPLMPSHVTYLFPNIVPKRCFGAFLNFPSVLSHVSQLAGIKFKMRENRRRKKSIETK